MAEDRKREVKLADVFVGTLLVDVRKVEYALVLRHVVKTGHADRIEQNAGQDEVVEAAVVDQVYHAPPALTVVRHFAAERSLGEFDFLRFTCVVVPTGSGFEVLLTWDVEAAGRVVFILACLLTTVVGTLSIRNPRGIGAIAIIFWFAPLLPFFFG